MRDKSDRKKYVTLNDKKQKNSPEKEKVSLRPALREREAGAQMECEESVVELEMRSVKRVR